MGRRMQQEYINSLGNSTAVYPFYCCYLVDLVVVCCFFLGKKKKKKRVETMYWQL